MWYGVVSHHLVNLILTLRVDLFIGDGALDVLISVRTNYYKALAPVF